MTWRPADVPDQTGRTVVVTGPSVGGVGFHVALELARRGGRVVLAGRSPDKVAAAAQAIRAEHPGAALEELALDLASLASVRRAAAAATAYGPVDVLVNNAGVMGTARAVTEDGFDLQLQTNALAPYLLTGLLLPQLVRASGRVVTLSSLMHRAARTPPDGFTAPRPYRRWRVYAQSKLADLLFTYELDRRLRRARLPVTALAAHPGISGSHLVANGRLGRATGGVASILDAAVRATTQPAAHGAWPVLMAATAELPGSTYVGPGGLGEVGGAPQVVGSSELARDPEEAREFWARAEAATGLSYP